MFLPGRYALVTGRAAQLHSQGAGCRRFGMPAVGGRMVQAVAQGAATVVDGCVGEAWIVFAILLMLIEMLKDYELLDDSP